MGNADHPASFCLKDTLGLRPHTFLHTECMRLTIIIGGFVSPGTFTLQFRIIYADTNN